MEGSSSPSGAKPAGSSRTMLIAIIIVIIIIVAAVAAVLLTQPEDNNPPPQTTNYLEKGFKMQIYYNTGNSGRQTACEILKTSLESLNPGKIQITVSGVQWADYLLLQQTSKMPLFFLGWAPDYSDPNDYVNPFLASTGTFPHTIGFGNATLDAMIAQAASNPDPVSRDAQYKDIGMLAYQLCPYIWMSQASFLFTGQTYISGYTYNPLYSNLYYYDLGKPGVNTTFTYGEISGNPQYFDPAQDYETAGGEVLQNVYETLVWYNSTNPGELIPLLTTELPSVENGGITNEGKSYTYHIRPDVTFQDGSALDAYDVAFSVERLLRLNDPAGPAWMDGEVLIPDYYSYGDPFVFNNATGQMSGGIQNDTAFKQAIWVKDPMTVQFNLTTPNPAWNAVLAFNANSIVSLKAVKAHLSAGNTNVFSKEAYEWVNANPVGTGPFKFVNFASTQYISLTRYDGYWRGPASIKNVLLQQIADDSSRINQLIAGDLDAALVPRAQQQAVFGKGLMLVNSSNFNLGFIGMNQKINTTGMNKDLNDIPSDFFSNINIRKAFASAFDFATYNHAVQRDVAIQPNGAIPKGMFGYHADIPIIPYNLTQAAAYLSSVTIPVTTTANTSLASFSAELVARGD